MNKALFDFVENMFFHKSSWCMAPFSMTTHNNESTGALASQPIRIRHALLDELCSGVKMVLLVVAKVVCF